MAWKVTEIIDVSPNWKWQGESGDTVRANGYNAPEEGQPGYQQAKDKLKKLIFGKEVELKNVIKITFGRLLCDVYIGGKNLADFFP